jgi:hypothetical protein
MHRPKAPKKRAAPALAGTKTKRAVPKTSRDKRGLTEHDWNFETITELNELQVCLLYELARESPLVRQLVIRWRRDNPFGQGVAECAQFNREIHEAMPKPHFAWLVHGWLDLIALWTNWKQAPAWLELPLDARNDLRLRLCGRPAVWTGNRLDACAIRDSLARIEKANPTIALPPACAVGDDGIERVILAIDWSNFDEPEIKAAFGRWLAGRRPKQWPALTQTQQGAGDPKHEANYRNLLGALGAARLSAKFTPRQLFDEWPDAWRFLGGGREFEASSERLKRRLLDGRKAVRKKFKEFFSLFVSHGEPICLTEFATRQER